MKTHIYLASIVIALAQHYACGQNPPTDPEWKATIKVVDEAGVPIRGATVEIAYFVKPQPDQSIAFGKKIGITGVDGVFSASEHSTSIELDINALKEGFYPAGKVYELGFPSQYDPVKWSPNLTLVLKGKGNQIPMYAKSVNLGMPAFDKTAAFDLMAGDWVAPYGKGASSDILFNAHCDRVSDDDYDYKLVVGFPNPGDGVQEFAMSQSDKESLLHSPHEAPSDGYQPQWIQTEVRRPGQQVKSSRDTSRNYFFRIRTVLDQNGKVESALYGKIYGDFLEFHYYLNPTPNSRNMEFDPKRDLITHLRTVEQVKAP